MSQKWISQVIFALQFCLIFCKIRNQRQCTYACVSEFNVLNQILPTVCKDWLTVSCYANHVPISVYRIVYTCSVSLVRGNAMNVRYCRQDVCRTEILRNSQRAVIEYSRSCARPAACSIYDNLVCNSASDGGETCGKCSSKPESCFCPSW